MCDHRQGGQGCFKKTDSIQINATPEAVFDYVSDFSRHPQWAHEKLDIKAQDGATGGAGSRYDATVHFTGAIPTQIHVVGAERPKRLVYECEDKASKHRWAFELRPEAGGTHVTHTIERQKEAKWFVPIQPVMYRILGKRMVAGGLANIKAKLEE